MYAEAAMDIKVLKDVLSKSSKALWVEGPGWLSSAKSMDIASQELVK